MSTTEEMDVRGHMVYCYKGFYFSFFNRCNAFPAGMGVRFASKVPHYKLGQEVFTTWVKAMRKRFQESLDVWSGEDGDEGVESERNMEITHHCPVNDDWIDWVYTADLDNLVFYVDNQPVFDLANLPQGDDFVRYVGHDNYGVRSYTHNTPEQHRYKWTHPSLKANNRFLTLYSSHASRDPPIAPIHELLDIPEPLTTLEEVRVDLMEVLVGHMRRSKDLVNVMNLILSDGLILSQKHDFCVEIVALARRTIVMMSTTSDDLMDHCYCLSNPENQVSSETTKYPSLVWIYSDLCLFVTNYLREDAILMSCVGKVVREVEKDSSRKGTIWAILFSLSHCSIVRRDIDNEGSTVFRHTPALSFLPSSHATDRSTPGISALVRLMVHLSDDSVIQDAFQVMKSFHRYTNFDDPLFSKVSDTIFSKIPVEVCGEIAKELNVKDILAFSHLSYSCRQAAAYALRYPRVEIDGSPYRLYRDMWRIRPTNEEWGRWKVDEPIRPNHDEKDEGIARWRFASPRDFSSSLFCATNPKLGECFVTLGIHADAAWSLQSSRASFQVLKQKRNFKIRVYKVDAKSLEEFKP